MDREIQRITFNSPSLAFGSEYAQLFVELIPKYWVGLIRARNGPRVTIEVGCERAGYSKGK